MDSQSQKRAEVEHQDSKSANSSHSFSVEETNACALHIKNCATEEFLVAKLSATSKEHPAAIYGKRKYDALFVACVYFLLFRNLKNI